MEVGPRGRARREPDDHRRGHELETRSTSNNLCSTNLCGDGLRWAVAREPWTDLWRVAAARAIIGKSRRAAASPLWRLAPSRWRWHAGGPIPAGVDRRVARASSPSRDLSNCRRPRARRFRVSSTGPNAKQIPHSGSAALAPIPQHRRLEHWARAAAAAAERRRAVPALAPWRSGARCATQSRVRRTRRACPGLAPHAPERHGLA